MHHPHHIAQGSFEEHSLHTHMGVGSTIRYARDHVFWPGINAMIKDHVQKCETCQSAQPKQQKETLLTTEIPVLPWDTVGTDLFHFAGEDILITTDYYSNYWEMDQLKNTLSRSVISALNKQFARHGTPRVLRTDNGPQFVSAKFKNFAKEWQFEHTTSSPLYPEPNGKAENSVKTA